MFGLKSAPGAARAQPTTHASRRPDGSLGQGMLLIVLINIIYLLTSPEFSIARNSVNCFGTAFLP